jgi:hypothetical protein
VRPRAREMSKRVRSDPTPVSSKTGTGSATPLTLKALPRPVDLRNGYDGLAALVAGQLRRNVLSGDCFLFYQPHAHAGPGLGRDGPLHLSEPTVFTYFPHIRDTISVRPSGAGRSPAATRAPSS